MPYKDDHLGVGSNILELSEEMSNGLDIFSEIPIDTSLTSGKTIYHNLNTALNEQNNVFEFVIPSEGHDYTDLPLTRLEGEVEITSAAGAALVAANMVAPINLLAATLFRQVECEFNGTQVADLTSPCYHYKSFIETHLSYGPDAKSTHLRCQLYYADTPGHEEEYTAQIVGFNTRRAWIIANTGKLYFSTPIHLDVFDSVRYLLPGITMGLKFLRNEDKFCLLSATDAWKLKVNALRISTRKLTIHPEILKAHQTFLLKQPAVFPLAMSKIKTFTLNQGISSKNLSGIFRGKLPRGCLFCFVKSDAFNGSFATNPFLFPHYNVSGVSLVVNGSPYPASSFRPNFATGNCMREYMHFHDNLGIYHGNETNGIDYDTFVKNTVIFPFDLSPDLCNSYHRHIENSGFVDLDLQFRVALPHNVTVIIYATYNEKITIDNEGAVRLYQ